MVRKSILVYDLLRTSQPEGGFTEKEIVEQISNRHAITAGKGLRKQVAVALRRGLDFGIIAKRNNRFRFDPASAKASAIRRGTSNAFRSSGGSKKKKKKTKRNAKRTGKGGRTRSSASTRNKNRKQTRHTPKPQMPKSWIPHRRNLADEPVSRVKKI